MRHIRKIKLNLFLSEKSEEKITQCWSKVKKYFQTFQEWFNDLEMYHYVGFLIDQGKNLKDLYDKWEGNKVLCKQRWELPSI